MLRAYSGRMAIYTMKASLHDTMSARELEELISSVH